MSPFPSIPLVVARPDLPYGAASIAAADSEAALVVLGPSPAPPAPSAVLSELLSGPYAIGAVLPATGEAIDSSIPADLDAGVAQWAAVRTAFVSAARVDPRESDPAAVVSAVLAAVRAGGLRVVTEPTWKQPGLPLADRPPESRKVRAVDVVVVTSGLTEGITPEDDASAFDLVASLAQCWDAPITVVTLESQAAGGAASKLRRQGVAVEQPGDGASWFAARRGRFSHAILASTAVTSAARNWIDTTQPQAAKVLHVSSAPFRRIDALSAITPRDELSALEYVRAAAEARFSDLVRWADVVWCERRYDKDFVSGLAPRKPVSLVPRALAEEPSSRDIALGGSAASRRQGVVLLASDGHDVTSGNEDASLRMLRQILPRLAVAGRRPPCTVITDWPTPMLETEVRRAGATTAPVDSAVVAARSARLVVAAHAYGTGGASSVRLALKCRTPFLVDPATISESELGILAPLATVDGDEAFVARANRLLRDDKAWSEFAEKIDASLTAAGLTEVRSDAVRHTGAVLGIYPRPAGARWPSPKQPDTLPRRKKPVSVPLRPNGSERLPGSGELRPASDPEAYRKWLAHCALTPRTLRLLQSEIRQLTHRPLISVLMPVWNPDPRLLDQAIGSVRDQIYTHWELCIANDGSDAPGVMEVLKTATEDPRIKVVDLPGRSGISAATNAAFDLATGDFVAFMDHDDLIQPHALAQVARWLEASPDLDVVYTDEDKIDEEGLRYEPHFKPDWSPDQLLCVNYVSHLTVARRSLVASVGALRTEYDGSQDYDLLLRLAEVTDRFGHIPEPLYSWRATAGSAAAEANAKPFAIRAAERAIEDALSRRGLEGEVEAADPPVYYKTRLRLRGKPRVSVIIPTKNGVSMLRRCVESIIRRTTYDNFEILAIDNQSTDSESLGYLADFPGRVIRYPYKFNYARMMNFGAMNTECDALLFLNNDTEVIDPDWMQALLEHAMRPRVGAVGGRLYFGDGRLQHEGIYVGVLGGWAANIDHGGWWSRGDMIRNASAVTGACTMIRPSVYAQVGGNDERLRVAYNDVDICLRIRQAGYDVVYTPYARLYHYESSTRSGYEHHEDGPLFGERWQPKTLTDDYYSPALSRSALFQLEV